ncbi:MAG: ATP-binding protein [Candidatus Omnitrophica bacterium]|nr:ATP-binding protein [Candidatus Omnitrophota bacterium]
MKKYVHRDIEREILEAAKQFPVVVLTGPRQTGKSTLFKHLFKGYEYFTLDDPLTRKIAKDDPKYFLSSHSKMIIDEIQYLPELLPYIKIAVDEDRGVCGRYLLTGSQCFPLMGGISESLAGRAALYELLGLSFNEIASLKKHNKKDCEKAIYNGFYPDIAVHGVDRNRYYSSYLQTYLERDIRQMTSVHDLKVFQDFLELLASRAGNLLNLNEISKECGVSFTTAKRWLSLLESTRIVYLLRSYSRNVSKRVVKSPKIYFTDTGLLSYLLRYPDAASLMSGPQAGALFENLIVAELLKLKINYNLNFELYFFRDSNHNEIDVVIDHGQLKYLLEIKATSTPRKEHFDELKKGISIFKAKAFLLSFTGENQNISENVKSIYWYDFFKTEIK